MEFTNLRDKEIWDIISVEREVGEKVCLPGFWYPLEVVSNEDFACKVIEEVSQMKYFYNIEAPIMYCLYSGIVPSNIKETINIVKKALKELGWSVKEE